MTVKEIKTEYASIQSECRELNEKLLPLLARLKLVADRGKELTNQICYGENTDLYKIITIDGNELEVHNDWNYQITGVLEDFACLDLSISNIETQLTNVLTVNADKK